MKNCSWDLLRLTIFANKILQKNTFLYTKSYCLLTSNCLIFIPFRCDRYTSLDPKYKISFNSDKSKYIFWLILLTWGQNVEKRENLFDQLARAQLTGVKHHGWSTETWTVCTWAVKTSWNVQVCSCRKAYHSLGSTYLIFILLGYVIDIYLWILNINSHQVLVTLSNYLTICLHRGQITMFKTFILIISWQELSG